MSPKKNLIQFSVVIIFLSLLSPFVRRLEYNLGSVELVKNLIEEPSCNDLKFELNSTECFRLLEISAQRSAYIQKPDIQKLLTAYSNLGTDNDYACRLMLIIGAKTRLIEPLSVATNNLDWVGIEECLVTIESAEKLPGFISPHQVSISYNVLANHYLKTDELDKATLNFQKAIAWYPVLWAEPVIQLANIYQLKGVWLQAEKTLITATQRASDHGNLYQVLKSLGSLWFNHNKKEAAYCAYFLAVQTGVNAPSSQVTIEDLENTRDQLSQLQDELKSSPDTCLDFLEQKGVTLLQND